MAKLTKTSTRNKCTKLIDKERIIVIMRANINGKTNNPNYLKVSKLTGVHRKTLKSRTTLFFILLSSKKLINPPKQVPLN